MRESYFISSQLTLLDSRRLKNIEVAKRAVAEERQERRNSIDENVSLPIGY